MYEDLFLKRLQFFRNREDVSARDMSLSLGQSEGYIRAVENHRYLPSMLVFFYICEYFKVSPSEFFDDKNQYPEELRMLFKDISSLSKEQLDLVISMVKAIKK